MTADRHTDLRPSYRLLAIRLALGLAQGLLLYGLIRYNNTPHRLSLPLLGALSLLFAFWPIVALGSIGALSRRTLTIWLAASAILLLGLGAYGGFTQGHDVHLWREPEPALYAMTAAALFIVHHLVMPADQTGRWIAPYERYFDEGWKDGVRVLLSAAFVGALWILLFLGGALFKLIGLDFLDTLISKPWFAWPASGLAFALAVHITDIRSSLVQGIRTLALTLLSVLLPLMALIGAGFLAALPFTGLQPLWATRSAASILLAACAALIILINAAYQAGERGGFPPLALKWGARVAAVLIAPLVVIAAYGVWLRTSQYGLTPERIQAAACLVVAACYGAGYFAAALVRGPWMKVLERTNIAAAYLIVAVILALYSPVADPARLSVASQVHRLNTGKVSPDKFDYNFLKFRSGRAGEMALDQLADHAKGPHASDIARLAKSKREERASFSSPPSDPARRAQLVKVAGGGALPDSFLKQKWSYDPLTACSANDCGAIVADLNHDGMPEIVLITSLSREVYGLVGGEWSVVGDLRSVYCPGDLAAIAAGHVQVTEPKAEWSDIEIDGRRLSISPPDKCPAQTSGQATVSPGP